MNLRRGSSVVLLCVFLAGCAGKSPIAPTATRITGTTWKLRSIQQVGSPTVEIPNPDRFTLSFGDDSRVSVRADCNVCSGSYQFADSELQVPALACTRAFCGMDSPDLRFLSALQSKTVAASRADGTLTLAAAGTLLLFAE
jgi:heat shock protein HslJ